MQKLMIIDDEESVCELLRKVFTPEGYQVLTSINPEQAIGIVQNENPDCVLLDIKMPKVDGIEVLAKIKEQNSAIRVIMITGYGNIESAMESMNLGAFDYITKPFDLEFIKTLVKNALEDKKQ